MNDQPLPPNSAGAGERPAGVRPESLPTGVPGAEVSRGEAVPGGGAPATPPASLQSQLSPAEVAAALAAVPGGTPPPSASGGTVPLPTTADDVDVIEPEWVNKAEAEVQKHIGDPYGEEEAIEDLQEDYLQKRYGYNVADPNADKDKPEGA